MTQAPPTPTTPPPSDAKAAASTKRRRRGSNGAAIIARGEPMVWLTGGALVLCLVMIAGLLGLVAYNGLTSFWPKPIQHFVTIDGQTIMGPVTRVQTFTPEPLYLEGLSEQTRASVDAELGTTGLEGDALADYLVEQKPLLTRRLVRSANFDVTGEHFAWVIDAAVQQQTQPEWAVTVERLEWGRFFGYPEAYAELSLLESADGFGNFDERMAEARTLLEGNADGRVLVYRRVRGREAPAFVPLSGVQEGDSIQAVTTAYVEGRDESWDAFQNIHDQARALRLEQRDIEKYELGHLNTLQEAARKRLRAVEITQGRDSAAYEQAQQTFEQEVAELQSEANRLTEQIDELKDINAQKRLLLTTAQGDAKLMQVSDIVRAFPANQLSWFGRLSVYLGRWTEFLTEDPREANSEGGVFPVIFGTVFMVLIMTILVVPFGVLAALYIREYAKAGPVISVIRIAINNLAGVPSIVYGVFGLGFFCYIVGAGIDDVFFPVAAADGNPVFGKTALIWASFTLALLTLPVVIVATEEALSAVPNSMREGSYACGASKWQTIKRIILPRALPGMMTGMILAMARGAGEVAPLMVVGAVKLAPELPFSIYPSEQFGINRSFMHLGFHIYDLGFQSQNSEAAKPMVYTTTLLLITIVVVMNVTAIVLRNRLRKKFVSGAF